MNPTYDTVTINDKIIFVEHNTNSHAIAESTAGLHRDSTNYVTSLPTDSLEVGREIKSSISMRAPISYASQYHFLSDLNGITPRIQNKAFTDTLYTRLNDNLITQFLAGTIVGTNVILSGAGTFTSSLTSHTFSNTEITFSNTDIFMEGISSIVLSNPVSATKLGFTSGSANNRMIENVCYIKFLPISLTGTASQIYHSGSTFTLENNTTSGIINFATKDAGGTLANYFNIDYQGLHSIANVHTSRQIDTCYFNVTSKDDFAIAGGRLWYSGFTMYVQNNRSATNSSINFAVTDNLGATQIPLSVDPSNVYLSKKMAAGVNVIEQTANLFATPDFTTNIFKRTAFKTRTASDATGTSTSSVDIHDESPNTERGFIFVPNASSDAFNPIVDPNDQVICGRRNQNAMNLVITCWASPALGLRLSALTTTTCTAVLRASTNIFSIADSNTSPTNPFTMNNNLAFVGQSGNLNARAINNLSSIGLYDSLGVSGTCILAVDSTTSNEQMRYILYTENFYHSFYTTVSGVQSVRFTIANGNISVVGASLFVRSSTPTTKLDIIPNVNGQMTIMASNTNASSVNNQILIKVKNSSQTTLDMVTYDSTLNEQQMLAPIRLSYVTPTSSNHLGHTTTTTYSPVNRTSGLAGVYNFGSYYPSKGTWVIKCHYKIENSSGTDMTMETFKAGVSTSDTSYSTGMESMSHLRHNNLFIRNNDHVELNTTTIYRLEANIDLYILGTFYFTNALQSVDVTVKSLLTRIG